MCTGRQVYNYTPTFTPLMGRALFCLHRVPPPKIKKKFSPSPHLCPCTPATLAVARKQGSLFPPGDSICARAAVQSPFLARRSLAVPCSCETNKLRDVFAPRRYRGLRCAADNARAPARTANDRSCLPVLSFLLAPCAGASESVPPVAVTSAGARVRAGARALGANGAAERWGRG